MSRCRLASTRIITEFSLPSYLQLALDADLTPEVRRNLSNSHAASRALVHVVNDLLELTQASEPGQVLFSQDPFDLPGTIEEAISVYRSEVEQRGLTLEVIENPSGTPPTLLGDRAKIKSIITNVVGNAVEHTRTGGILVEWGELADVVSRGVLSRFCTPKTDMLVYHRTSRTPSTRSRIAFASGSPCRCRRENERDNSVEADSSCACLTVATVVSASPRSALKPFSASLSRSRPPRTARRAPQRRQAPSVSGSPSSLVSSGESKVALIALYSLN